MSGREHGSVLSELLRTLDAYLEQPVVIFGKLPPIGQDLDLLVRPRENEALAHACRAYGFYNRGHRWARFRNGAVDAIELVPTAWWGLTAGACDQLFAQGTPVRGTHNFLFPDGAHALLILARKVTSSGIDLTSKHRKRIDKILEADPAAAVKAEALAPGWAAVEAFNLLWGWYTGDKDMTRFRRLRASVQDHTGSDRFHRRLARGISQVLPRYGRGSVIALSGLDGAGKTTQATALRETLRTLGYDAEIRWTSLTAHPRLLKSAVAVVKKVAGRVSPRQRREVFGPTDGDILTPGTGPDRVRAARERSTKGTMLWTMIVAIANVWSHIHIAMPALFRGRVVICDRYILDSYVNLRYHYSDLASVRRQMGIVTTFSPKPLRSYFLEVPAKVATKRRGDYTVEQNSIRASHYREGHERLGYSLLNGQRSAAELAAEIGRQSWFALPRR